MDNEHHVTDVMQISANAKAIYVTPIANGT